MAKKQSYVKIDSDLKMELRFLKAKYKKRTEGAVLKKIVNEWKGKRKRKKKTNTFGIRMRF